MTVVGGGLTGLETVAEIAESRPDLDVRLVTAGEVGGWFDTRGEEYVRGTLRGLGVEAVGGVRVRAAEPGRLSSTTAPRCRPTSRCGAADSPRRRWRASPGSPSTNRARC